MLKLSVVALAASLALATAAGAQAPPAYKVVKTVALGAPDRWDYVVFDQPSHRVYVAHGDRVSIVDGRTGAVLGAVEGIRGGTHGIAVAAGRGFTDDGKAGEAAVFDPKTLKVTGKLKAEDDADGIVVDPKSGHVFVLDGDSGKVTVIDPKADKVVATIDGGGGLEYAVADGKGSLYVNGAEKHEIVRIDTASNKVLAHWAMDGCEKPRGLAMDEAAGRLFSTCSNGVMEVLDSGSGKVLATLPIGPGSDAAAFDPKRKLAFSPNGGDGTLTVVREKSPTSFAVAATVKTAVSGRTMAIDPETGRLYIAAADVGPAPAAGGRPRPLPGSLKLLFLDPSK